MNRPRIRAMKVMAAFIVIFIVPVIVYLFFLLPYRERTVALCTGALGSLFPISLWWFEFRSRRKR